MSEPLKMSHLILILQSNSTFKQRVTRKLISHALGVVGCTGLMFTGYFTITGDEQFYQSFIMPSVMRVLGAEQAHTFAVWLASKGLIPVDVDGDPEILVNLENKDFQWFCQKCIFFLEDSFHKNNNFTIFSFQFKRTLFKYKGSTYQEFES